MVGEDAAFVEVQPVVGGEGADPQCLPVAAHIAKVLDPTDVHECSGSYEPEVHEWNEALASSEETSVLTKG
jgi:hypothetical protein